MAYLYLGVTTLFITPFLTILAWENFKVEDETKTSEKKTIALAFVLLTILFLMLGAVWFAWGIDGIKNEEQFEVHYYEQKTAETEPSVLPE